MSAAKTGPIMESVPTQQNKTAVVMPSVRLLPFFDTRRVASCMRSSSLNTVPSKPPMAKQKTNSAGK